MVLNRGNMKRVIDDSQARQIFHKMRDDRLNHMKTSES